MIYSRALQLILLTSFVVIALTSCYRAPNDQDFCTIPATNNPCVTRHGDKFQPGMAY